MIPKPVVLIVLDGWGLAPEGSGNPLSAANLPTFRSLWAAYPHTKLLASGEAVGLPHNEAGNSEVGHINLGAGFVVYQDLARINRAIADGSFLKNEALLAAVNHAKKNHSRVHILGLISPSFVHSSLEHLYALLHLCQEQNFKDVFIHTFTDGRDSPPTSSQVFLSELMQKCGQLGVGQIASVVGRYYALDRDERWERTKLAYEMLTYGKGLPQISVLQAVSDAYKRGETDEFIKPTVITRAGQPVAKIQSGDAVIFFNFRADRPRQLTSAFVQPIFEGFERGEKLKDLFFTTLTIYEKDLPVSTVAFLPEDVKLPLVRILSLNNLRQLHLAESEKFPHVTYFFNGGREDPFEGEDRIEIPSPRVPTYDLKPEMSAFEVTDILIERIKEDLYDFMIVNFANADMVGHTGNFEACVKAVEILDGCLKKIVNLTKNQGGAALITADHGNVEVVKNSDTGSTDTEHNVNPVPFIYVGKTPQPQELQSGILADIAPTILGLLKIPKPSAMTGKDLLPGINL